MSRVVVFGTSWLGAEVLGRLRRAGHDVCLITTPSDRQAYDAAVKWGVKTTVKCDRFKLISTDFPWQPDLTVSAHSFRIVPRWVRDWSRLGSIGYHPSLLPAFKGKHAIQDALDAGVTATGGSVYWLTDGMDAGPIAMAGGKKCQESVKVLPDESAAQIWRRALAPLGADLLEKACAAALEPK
ncbi:MAG: formyltransferase family protein [Octadecabacter sp.]